MPDMSGMACRSVFRAPGVRVFQGLLIVKLQLEIHSMIKAGSDIQQVFFEFYFNEQASMELRFPRTTLPWQLQLQLQLQQQSEGVELH